MGFESVDGFRFRAWVFSFPALSPDPPELLELRIKYLFRIFIAFPVYSIQATFPWLLATATCGAPIFHPHSTMQVVIIYFLMAHRRHHTCCASCVSCCKSCCFCLGASLVSRCFPFPDLGPNKGVVVGGRVVGSPHLVRNDVYSVYFSSVPPATLAVNASLVERAFWVFRWPY